MQIIVTFLNIVSLQSKFGSETDNNNQRNLQYHKNNMFRNDQRQLYKELDGKMNGQTEAPNPGGFTKNLMER